MWGLAVYHRMWLSFIWVRGSHTHTFSQSINSHSYFLTFTFFKFYMVQNSENRFFDLRISTLFFTRHRNFKISILRYENHLVQSITSVVDPDISEPRDTVRIKKNIWGRGIVLMPLLTWLFWCPFTHTLAVFCSESRIKYRL